HDVTKDRSFLAVDGVDIDDFIFFDIGQLFMQVIVGARVSKHILHFTGGKKTWIDRFDLTEIARFVHHVTNHGRRDSIVHDGVDQFATKTHD
ncbi:MAG: hypothetical protein RL011_550, partial [Pseudomonadota bacterium]